MNTETTTSLHDDISAAITKASEPAPATPADPTPAPAAPAPSGSPTATPPAPTAATPPPTAAPGAPVRGPDGRFAPASGQETPPPIGQPAAQTPPAGQETPAVTPPGQVALDPSKPPSGWRPEAKEKWATIPEDIRQEIVRREEASAQGVARLRQQYAPLEKVGQTLSQHSQYFQQIGVPAEQYIQDVIQIEQTLTLGNPAQKMQAILDLGEQYGIPLRQVIDSAMGGQLAAVMQQSHLQHKTPPAIPADVARELAELRANQQRIEDQAADAELRSFEATNPPLYEEARDAMADLLDKGLAATYQEAYDLAVWRDPALRARAQAIGNGQAALTGIQARQAAAASISTPAPAPISIAPQDTDSESTEDTVRRMWNSSGGGV